MDRGEGGTRPSSLAVQFKLYRRVEKFNKDKTGMEKDANTARDGSAPGKGKDQKRVSYRCQTKGWVQEELIRGAGGENVLLHRLCLVSSKVVTSPRSEAHGGGGRVADTRQDGTLGGIDTVQ